MLRQGGTQDQYLRVEAEFEIGSQLLVVRYRVTPLTHDQIAIFDGLMRVTADGRLKWDPFMAYVSRESQNTLSVKRVIPPLPKLKDVEFAHVPLVHIIHDQVHRGEIRRPIPVEEYNPYYPPSTKAVYSTVVVQFVALVLEYVIINNNITLLEVEGLPNLYRVRGTNVDLRQIRLVVKVPEPGIAVKQRRDMFERV
ncbi:hypothetical protein HRbin15_02375 [bacterium HR15]|nr:hypothetical protein HRbin15_02375 [bacterium HR15]